MKNPAGNTEPTAAQMRSLRFEELVQSHLWDLRANQDHEDAKREAQRRFTAERAALTRDEPRRLIEGGFSK